MASKVPWPAPVAAREPNTSTRRSATELSESLRRSMKLAPARIGPTVWELDGPMPTVKRSKTLNGMAITSFLMR